MLSNDSWQDELIAKKDRSVSGWGIQYLLPFQPEPESELCLKNGWISGQPESDIWYIPSYCTR